ncbi:MAG: hypothetical protein BWY63_01931 [Chloroflexi bacterium ADurb.Bin360]|nr:MAG: hypothetical protein BWY63_01931 [Chloroflexi bacterium ADurb.Bin360]
MFFHPGGFKCLINFAGSAESAWFSPSDYLEALFPGYLVGGQMEEFVTGAIVVEDAMPGILNAQYVGNGVEE